MRLFRLAALMTFAKLAAMRAEAKREEANKGMGDLEPTPGEKNEEGFPIRARVQIQGLPEVRIEQRKGEVREGPGWSVKMPYHYGDFDGTLGADGDPIDVCVGPEVTAAYAYIVHQRDPTSKTPKAYDEDKVMVGWPNKAAAVAAFREAYNKPGFLGEVTRMTIGELQLWLERHGREGRRIRRRDLAEATKALNPAWLDNDAKTGREPCPDCECYPCDCDIPAPETEGAKGLPEALKWE